MPYTITQLTKSPSESIFVLNTSISVSKHKRSTNVSFEISYNNQIRSILVQDSWIPQDLTAQAPKEVILASPDFRQAINRGLIELVPDPDAEKILAEEDAVIEATRLKNKYNSATKDLDAAPIMPRDIITEMSADDHPNVSSMIKDICARDDIDPIEIYSRLRSSEKTLSKEDWAYLNKNLGGAARTDKVNKILANHR
jgi:hypothetical protein